MARYVIGVTGASGSILAMRLAQEILKRKHELFLVVTHSGLVVIKQELGLDLLLLDESKMADAILDYLDIAGQLKCFSEENIAASIASGSFRVDGMAVIPCSMGTVHSIAYGASQNLLERAADVAIKEKTRLVIVPRETPLSTIHLKNMTLLSEYGAYIMPFMPSFYINTKSIDEMIDSFIGRVMGYLGIENDLVRVWNGLTD